jgi:hypothetical protein
MTEEPRRPRTERHVRHHEVDIEPHAHPGEPRRLVTTDHESCPREPVPRFAPSGVRERRRASRDRF